jgi:hypothetical protein
MFALSLYSACRKRAFGTLVTGFCAADAVIFPETRWQRLGLLQAVIKPFFSLT